MKKLSILATAALALTMGLMGADLAHADTLVSGPEDCQFEVQPSGSEDFPYICPEDGSQDDQANPGEESAPAPVVAPNPVKSAPAPVAAPKPVAAAPAPVVPVAVPVAPVAAPAPVVAAPVIAPVVVVSVESVETPNGSWTPLLPVAV